MIISLKGKFAEAVSVGRPVKGLPADVFSAANRRMQMIANASTLKDLRSPPGNRLEALQEGRAGHHSIRVNDQWRICFRWTEAGAEDVEIIDYHD